MTQATETMTWDKESRMLTNSLANASYVYNGFDARVSKTVSSTTTTFKRAGADPVSPVLSDVVGSTNNQSPARHFQPRRIDVDVQPRRNKERKFCNELLAIQHRDEALRTPSATSYPPAEPGQRASTTVEASATSETTNPATNSSAIAITIPRPGGFDERSDKGWAELVRVLRWQSNFRSRPVGALLVLKRTCQRFR